MHRQRFLPELKSNNFNIRSFGEAALNTPIQGSAADIIKKPCFRSTAAESEGLAAKMVLQVHDELIVEAPQEEAKIVADILTGDAKRHRAESPACRRRTDGQDLVRCKIAKEKDHTAK